MSPPHLPKNVLTVQAKCVFLVQTVERAHGKKTQTDKAHSDDASAPLFFSRTPFSFPFIRFDRSFLETYSSRSEDERFPSAGVSAFHVTDAFKNAFRMIRLWVKLPPGSAVHSQLWISIFIHSSASSFLPSHCQKNKMKWRTKGSSFLLRHSWRGCCPLEMMLIECFEGKKPQIGMCVCLHRWRPPWSARVGLGWMISAFMGTVVLKMSGDQAEVMR